MIFPKSCQHARSRKYQYWEGLGSRLAVLKVQGLYQAAMDHMWDRVNSRMETVSFGSSVSAITLPFLDLFRLAAQTDPHVHPGLCTGALLHKAATLRAFLTGWDGHKSPLGYRMA
jgi:hypothetical protein